jgi:hypothetical protein
MSVPVVVIAAGALVEAGIVDLESAARLEAEIVVHVGEGGGDAGLDALRGADLDLLDPVLGGSCLVLELLVAGLQRCDLGFERVQAVEHRVARRGDGRGGAWRVVGDERVDAGLVFIALDRVRNGRFALSEQWRGHEGEREEAGPPEAW